MSADAPAILFSAVDVIFGDNPAAATDLLDQGLGRDEVFARTDQLVAVHDASLEVEEGELCVLMGLSGSGKSSLLRCVNGLNVPARGKVVVRCDDEIIDVTDGAQVDLRRLRRDWVSMVFQQFALMPWRKVSENVGFGLELRGLPRPERARIVAEKLALVKLEDWADYYPGELSGGMQQRVGLARAFATDADILLMDEPFSALDPLIRSHLQDELLELQRRLRKTILFVSHDLDEALKIGNRIVIMEGGRIIQVGRPEEIVVNPANQYVADFVSHVNPLNVLRAGTVMGDGSDLVVDRAGRVRIDPDLRLWGELDEQDRLVALRQGGSDVPVVEPGIDDIAAGAIAIIDPETPFKEALRIRQLTGRPLLVVDRDGRLLGRIGAREVEDALLRS